MPSISQISYYLPQNILTNEELEKEYESWSANKIYRKTGIENRHIANEEATSEMAVKAAEALFNSSQDIIKDNIDFLLLCTQSPDYFLPTTACLVQQRLGLPQTIGALDFNLGCSGYIYGLLLASSLIQSNQACNVLLLTSEKYCRYIHPQDKSTRTIFGDGATATLISVNKGFATLDAFDWGTDGSGAKNLIVPAGGDALPCSVETAKEQIDESGNIRSLDNIYMNGPEIFTFTLNTVPLTIERVLAKASLAMEDIDFFVFHQANKFMLETLRIKLNIPEEKFIIDMKDYGNTVSSTIPIALGNARRKKLFHNGAKILLAGFGVGYSWGSAILTWKE
ncbi:3-oxoacyl-ACP synthase III family protein [Aminobacterium mobile]